MLAIFYVMDMLRYDYLSCYGNPRGLSPNIDAIAYEGVLFENAFSQTSWTRPSGASMLTSTYPTVHNVLTVNEGYLQGIPTLPEALGSAGFKTAAISSMGHISLDFGFGRGFDEFIELYKDKSLLNKKSNRKTRDKGWAGRHKTEQLPIPTGEDINDALFPLIEKYKGQDLFVFIWSIDTHGPYFHRDTALARFCAPSEDVIWGDKRDSMTTQKEISHMKDLYSDMVYYNDHHIGVLKKRLVESGLYDDTLLILTADHGEAFGEHGVNGHAGIPFDEQIHVPLIMKFPGGRWKGRVGGLAQHIDLFPTVMGFVGKDTGSSFVQGKDLMPIIRGEKDEVNQYLITETRQNKEDPLSISVRTRDAKYIELIMDPFKRAGSLGKTVKDLRRRVKSMMNAKRFLFSLKEDPSEQNNLIGRGKSSTSAEALASIYREVSESNRALAGLIKRRAEEEVQADADIRSQLRALGYID